MNVADSTQDADDSINFADLEQSFSRVVQEMVNDKSLEKFRIEYEKLHEALIASHEHNTILVAKCNELNEDILKNTKQITNIISLTQADQRTINTLRQEFEKAWVIVEESTNKEQQARRIINNLKDEVDNLSGLIAQSGNIHDDEEIPLQDVEKEINALKSEIQNNNEKITELMQNIESTKEKYFSIKDIIKTYPPVIEQNTTDIQQTTDDINKIHNVSVEYHDSMNAVQLSIAKSNIDSNEIDDKISEKKEEIKDLNRRLTNVKNSMAIYIDERASIDKIVNELKINLHEAKTQTDLSQRQYNERLEKYNYIVQNNQDLPDKIVQLDNEAKELISDQQEIKKYKDKLTEAKLEYRMCFSKNRDMTLAAKREINGEILDTRRYRLNIDTVEKQTRDVEKLVEKQESETQQQRIQQEAAQKDINNVKLVKLELYKIIEQLQEEIRKSVDQSREFNNHLQHEEQMIEKTKKMIDEANIKLNEIQLDIKRVNQSKDIMRNERDFVGQKLKLEKGQTDGIKKSYETSKRQAEGLKEEIMELDDNGVKEHLKLLHFEDELEELLKVNEKTRNDTLQKLAEAKVMEKNVLNHRHILAESEIDIESIKRNLNNLQASISLITNNIAEKLVEKQNQKSNIIAMNNILNQNVRSFDALISKIADHKVTLSQELNRQEMLRRKIEIMKAFKQEVIRLEKELISAQSYEAAIVEELSNPITISRWIFLDSTNPELASLMRMKLALLDEISKKMTTQQKLKLKKKDLDEKIEKETRKIVKTRGTVFDDEYNLLQEELRRKTKELNDFKRKFEQNAVAVNEIFEEKEEAKTELRLERNEVQIMKQRNLSARASATGKSTKGKFKFNEKVKGRDLMFVGGGFAYGGTQNVPLIAPPTQTIRTKKDKFLPTLDIHEKTDLRRRRPSKCSSSRSSQFDTEEFEVKPPSSRSQKSKNPRSSRRRMKKAVDE